MLSGLEETLRQLYVFLFGRDIAPTSFDVWKITAWIIAAAYVVAYIRRRDQDAYARLKAQGQGPKSQVPREESAKL